MFSLVATVEFARNFSQYSAIPPQTSNKLSCPEPLSQNWEIFNVYLTESSIAESALPLLCTNPVVKRQYGNVVITIGGNDFDTFRFINHGVPELTLVKSNVVEAFGADHIYYYKKLAAHTDYSAYFIALREKPQLSKEYLLGKRIGILDYPSSRSGHIVPKTVLQQLGLNDKNIRLNYFNSHQQLRQALLAGDVDLISSYWSASDEKTLSRNYITSLESTVSGMRWYLKMQDQNTDLQCAVQEIIAAISASHPRRYYRDVFIFEECTPDEI